MKKVVLISLFVSALMSCSGAKRGSDRDRQEIHRGERVEIKYAKGFVVKDFGDYRLVDIVDPVDENDAVYRYALLKKGAARKAIPEGYTIIETPVGSVICMTTLQISNFIKLDAVDKIAGISSTRFLFNKTLKQQLNDSRTKRIGIEGNFDKELIIALNPDIIFVSPFKKGGYEAVKHLGIPLVTFLGYKESSPLGQAEWIKFTGMLLGIEEEANKRFDAIERRYNGIKEVVESVKHRPTVLSGELHGGNWYVVGGKSYLANLFKDAGANYFIKDDKESGGFYMDFEKVYAKGAKADFWRVVNSFDGDFSYDAMQKTDSRYADFDAFKKGKIIYCNLRQTPFYENTPVEPEVVLADLIKAFHPALLPEYEPVYYNILQE